MQSWLFGGVLVLATSCGRGTPPSTPEPVATIDAANEAARDPVGQFWGWFASTSGSLRNGDGNAALLTINDRLKELGIGVSAEIETAKPEWRLVITAD